ncbi:hypothetical protein [Maribacter sp. 2307ULW6-5]|uniref:hypothetical protein n=1 Tax=Maribacter sp. 2307ULW6-5 TaxID=3386275 RepID=UPI0039BC7827
MSSIAKLYLKRFLRYVIPFSLALILANKILDLGMHTSDLIFTTLIAGGLSLGSITRK